jgi:two-component system catabolic regulation response regulator CreB
MPHTILVVDDEPTIADAIAYALGTEGMRVIRAATAGEARAALGREAVDLVVLDVGLPDDNGFDLCRDIRRGSEVPIIFVTARAVEVDRIVGLELGADDYVAKPFSPRELSARVKAVLRRSGDRRRTTAAPPASAEAPPFVVDERKLAIAFCGRAVELSRYQFRILKALIDRPGEVFSRGQLMDAAWDEPDASFDRAVDTHIKQIRAKLRAIRPDVDPIQTHRGEGYSLRERW